jgi:hypothetical protein
MPNHIALSASSLALDLTSGKKQPNSGQPKSWEELEELEEHERVVICCEVEGVSTCARGQLMYMPPYN